MTLSLEDFPAIFDAIHGAQAAGEERSVLAPFAWQTRLLREVVAHGWPDIVDAPTGAGKTAVLDIALFHLALAASGATCSPPPRRIVFAVDRRVIVDQAFNRARKLRQALASCADAGVQAMAEALRRLAGGDEPLHVEMLRGGMPREDEWARSPIQPTILCTTVDQLGSRLLFRGYGVSPSMAPIHAGLLGGDALLLLDEAHLARPFQQTLDRVGQIVSQPGGGARPWAFCSLTATPREATGKVFRLSDAERAEPAITTRLRAAKTAELEFCRDRSGSNDHVAAVVSAATQLVQQCTQPAPTVAIIVNRVALARAVLQALQAGDHDAILLTGRVRPVERERLLNQHEARLTSRGGATESDTIAEAPTRPLFVVATQCIEAGADFDFDAMVTQIAPLDALQQRFGRLNRLGLRDRAPAVIIAARDEIARGNDDPLYQGTLRETWEWLSARAQPAAPKACPALHIGPQAFSALLAADPAAAAKCVVAAKDAPVLRGADVGFLTMTNPRPLPDPYLPLFLHGEPTNEADVSIVWRADCEILASSPEVVSQAGVTRIATAIVACQPPMPGEALRVPIWAAKAWLTRQGSDAANITDAEGERDLHPDERYPGGRPALRWRGADHEDTGLIRAGGLRAGDLIIVPSSYGGCDRFGWAPESRAPTADIADAAAVPYQARYFALRLHSALWEDGWVDAWPRLQQSVVENAAQDVAAQLRQMLSELPPSQREGVARFPANLSRPRFRLEFPYDAEPGDGQPSGAVLIATRGITSADERRAPAASTEDDMTGCFADGSVSLARHTRDVVEQAGKFVAALKLGDTLANTLAFAAQYHDAGKADPRFQDWLRGPEPASREPLAKSGRRRGDIAENIARTAAGVPAHWRHEVLSVRVARQHLGTAGASIDPALALYLIGTHHGRGRPFFPHSDPWDSHPREVLGTPIAAEAGPERLDFDWCGGDWAELFAGLQAKYGPWGLAFLEAVLRLADHRASERLP